MSNINEESGKEIKPADTEKGTTTPVKHFIGRGIYGSKDVPIKVLDTFIGIVIALIVIMVIIFAINGGYNIRFDTLGGSGVDSQKLRYGSMVAEPETPIRAGYEFEGWVTSQDESLAQKWNFAEDTVENDMTLYAVWTPAKITVKFDLDGGNVDGAVQIDDIEVVFGENYGSLPTPVKDGYKFDGWVYSGNIITGDTIVSTSGEHILTARWISQNGGK